MELLLWHTLCHLLTSFPTGTMSLAMIEEHTAMFTKTLAPQRSWSVTPNQIPHPIQFTRNQEETLTSQEPTDDIIKGGLSESGERVIRRNG